MYLVVLLEINSSRFCFKCLYSWMLSLVPTVFPSHQRTVPNVFFFYSQNFHSVLLKISISLVKSLIDSLMLLTFFSKFCNMCIIITLKDDREPDALHKAQLPVSFLFVHLHIALLSIMPFALSLGNQDPNFCFYSRAHHFMFKFELFLSYQLLGRLLPPLNALLMVKSTMDLIQLGLLLS